jgi:hypothetical protein
VLYLTAGVAGVLAAVVGYGVTAMLTLWIAGLYGVSDFEGGRGMLAFLGIGPMGGLVGMVVGVWLVLRRGRGRTPLGPTLARAGLVLLGIAAVVGAGVWLRLATIDTYSDTLPPQLEFEVRLPARMAVADRSATRVALNTDRNVADAVFFDPWARTEGEHQVIAGVVELAFKTSSRLLVVSLPDQTDRLYRLPLSRDPASTPTLGDWRRPDHIATQGDAEVRKAATDDPVELRFRVRRAGDPDHE